MLLFDYFFDKATPGAAPFQETLDYILKVPCENRPEILDYIFRSYRYGEWLYVTDIFPAMFLDDKRCFKRFTSHEGFIVNMRRLAVTCVHAFVRDVMKANPSAVMVISGSYEDGEVEKGPSRKLRLYSYFFGPILGELGLRSVEMPGHNAFMLVRCDSSLQDEVIVAEYLEFKARKES